MPDSEVQAALDAYVNQITQFSSPLAIYLFGSLARDEASVESDIDLLIIYLDQVTAKAAQREVLCQRAPYRLAADLVFIDLETWEGTRHYSALVSVVKDEGKLVYASGDWQVERNSEK